MRTDDLFVCSFVASISRYRRHYRGRQDCCIQECYIWFQSSSLNRSRYPTVVPIDKVNTMSSHANINRLLFKHPLGNTPASSLTQDLPWEEDVKLLLLGCGDMRNVLYTVYSERDKEGELFAVCCPLLFGKAFHN